MVKTRESKGKHAAYIVAAILTHVALGGALTAIALTLPLDELGLLAASAMLVMSLFLTAVYLHNFGTERVGSVRAGPVGLTRGYMIFLMWMVFGYLALLFALGSTLGPSTFIVGLVVFWIMVIGFFVASIIWTRQERRRVASQRRTV